MTNAKAEVTIEDAVKTCLDEGSPDLAQELAELFREQEHLLTNKYLLYKMIIRHLIMSDCAGCTRSSSPLNEAAEQGLQPPVL